ncbi:MAG: metallophosphoesterase [Myxococcota bacterium]
MKHRTALLCLLAACLQPSSDHEALDELVGEATTGRVRIETSNQAAVLQLDESGAELWAAAPRLELRAEGIGASLTLRIRNVLPDAALFLNDALVRREDTGRPTVGLWNVPAEANGQVLRVQSPDADEPRPHAIGVLSDVQEDVGRVDDIFARMNEDDLRFVVSTGDLTENGGRGELERFITALEGLDVPFYTTAGNHEVPGPANWHALLGPFSVFFEQHGVAYSLADSSNATLDPALQDRMRPFLNAARNAPHLFFTHVPLLDPSGLRAGAFRSRNEAAKHLQDLAEANVDALFFGHVHSYYAFDLAGIPSFISGGGGAIPERLDGIGRHYLRVELLPASTEPIEAVAFVRVQQ